MARGSYADRVIEMFHRLGLGALRRDRRRRHARDRATSSALLGMPIVGVPKTIDNDIVGTTNCFGFDTAVAFATDAIDRLHTTAEAHKRILVVEVMGRYAGWIALYAGVAGGADAILIPEIPFDIGLVAERLRERDKWGAKFSIVVVAEGALPEGRHAVARSKPRTATASNGSAGIGAQVCDALARRDGQGNAARRARPPAARRRADQLRSRSLATRFGGKAVELVRRGEFGTMVAFAPPDIIARPLDEVVGKTKTVPMDFDVLRDGESPRRHLRRLRGSSRVQACRRTTIIR